MAASSPPESPGGGDAREKKVGDFSVPLSHIDSVKFMVKWHVCP